MISQKINKRNRTGEREEMKKLMATILVTGS
jgi:hypothetical protein